MVIRLFYFSDVEPRTKTIATMVTSTPVSEMCACKSELIKTSMMTIRPFSTSSDVDKEPCNTESTAVIAGGVGGGIMLCLPIAIFCICNRYCVFVQRNVVCCVRVDFALV